MENIKKMNWGKLIATFLRVVIGWHLFYEGFSKIIDGNWTAHQFLANTTGFLSGFYQFLASSPALMKTVDLLNMYGLTLIGLALFIGVFIRYAAAGGVVLLALYYFAYPPFGASIFRPNEGQLFIVDKNFIEAMALLYFVVARETGYGIDALRNILARRKEAAVSGDLAHARVETNSRREILKNLATFPVLGFMGWGAISNQKKHGVDVMSGATIQVNQASLSELKGTLPMGKIGNYPISRLVMGSNLINAYAHARDLIYANALFKAYNTENKVFETFMLGENAGINSISMGTRGIPLVMKYRKLTGSKLIVIGQIPAGKDDNYFDPFYEAIDQGVEIMQIHGGSCDQLVKAGKIDVIHKIVEKNREQGYAVGLGAHDIESLLICEKYGIIPDYYMKTMHHDNYWSAHPRENREPFEVIGRNSPDHNKYHDNIFDLFPDQTVDFVNRVDVPVMAFKVLAAGSIKPEDGFRWAFENGADFICAGMFDFQIVRDVNIAIDILNNLENRSRQWHA
jgi:uncharacterized membrane protein YphA (DoxX/SURF4 family)